LQEEKDAVKVKKAIINQGFLGQTSQMVNAIGEVLLGLLPLFFKFPTYVIFGAGVSSTVAGLLPNERQALTDMTTQKLIGLQNAVNSMASTNYDLIEFDVPKIRFKHNDSSKNWEMTTGNIRVIRMHSKSGLNKGPFKEMDCFCFHFQKTS